MPDETETKAFKELGISTAGQWALSGDEPEAEQKLQGMDGIKTWEEMRLGDHTAGAILAGLTLPIRRSTWEVEPASSGAADEEAAEFLAQCMEDMSHSWSSMIVDALTFFPFGWAYLEQVMKRRQGIPPGKEAARSKYNDGRVAWRKISLRPQTTLSAWRIDDHGGIHGIEQDIPEKEQPVFIPIQRSLLFRTTTEGNRPEGISIFRQAWRPWVHRKSLEMTEGIAYKRNLAGILKARLGAGATTEAEAGRESDEYKARQILKDAYEDRLVGVIETDQVAITVLDGPKGTQFAAIGRSVVRKDTEMARSTLAHFITLSLQERGSYALAKDESDLFLMAVMAYLDSMTDVIQRFAVERLFRFNVFPNITDIPQIRATAVYKPDLTELAEFINNLANCQLLTIDDGLEEYIRSLADFPELPVELSRQARQEAEEDQPEKPPPGASPEGPSSEEAGLTAEEEDAAYATRRRSPKQRGYLSATDAYEQGLTQSYQDWAGDTSGLDLGPETTEEELWAQLDDWLAVGLLLLMEKGYQDLLAAYVLGFGSQKIGPEDLELVAEGQRKNDDYLTNSLFADIRGKLEGEIAAILLLLKYGRQDEALHLIEQVALSLDYRPGLYAGTYWEMIHAGIGMRLTERGAIEGPPVRRVLNPLARHCTTCPPKEREYANWDAMVVEAGVPGDGSDECDGRCRCGVQILQDGVWVWY